MKSFLSGLLIAILALLTVLVTAELVLRVTGWGLSAKSLHMLHELRLDRPWLFGLRPGIKVTVPATGDVVYEINEEGFRDRLYTRTPRPGTFRIIVLGNSVAFGYGVDVSDTFPKRLEEILNERHPETHFEVLNFSVNGYNAYNQEAQLQDVGLAYEPDLVLVQFSVGVIHNPTLHFDHQTQMHLGMIPAEAFPNPSQRIPPPEFPALVRACSKLRTCSWFDERFLAPMRRKAHPLPGLISVGPRELPPGPERDWLRTRYREIEQTARSIGAEFAIVAFPYREQIYANASGRLEEQLVELGREENWLLINLLPAFKRAAPKAPPLFLDTWHVTPAGHRIAAEVIADQLRDHGFLPEPGNEKTNPQASVDLVHEGHGLR